MNTIWSEHVQGPLTLYLSRKLRFDDSFRSQYQELFGLDIRERLKILEVGCGPGALAGALHRWYPNAVITALDRDSRFIAFAREQEPGIRFVEGDAAALPFPDHSFDVTISCTVQEHMDPRAFWREQKRVLKPDGVCICISARKSIGLYAGGLAKTEEELRFWNGVTDEEDVFEKYGVGRYWLSESELPLQMEEYGFRNVSTGYVLSALTPDNPGTSGRFAVQMIEAERQSDLEAVLSAHTANADEAIRAINRKYDERLKLYAEGKKQWDTEIAVMMVLRGLNPE